ncbi:MAG TPA: DUF6600 domain-containing protein [Polyangiaceae bacterium]|nr:DUF6600 domain-containing protein [Polyangiaceae bacterium]
MNWTGVTASLLVAVAPTASRCDPAGPSAAPDDTPSAQESPPLSQGVSAAASPTPPQSAQAPENSAAPMPDPEPAPGTPPQGPPQGIDAILPASEATLQTFPPGGGAQSGPGADSNGPVGNGSFVGGAYDGTAVGYDAAAYDDADPSALTDFRGALDPYGTWSDDPTLGTVWAPSPDAVGPDFRPYLTDGHWTYDTDWIWVSDYVWGWVPFHYGRWIFLRGRGWSWIPGRSYHGAWVLWSVNAAVSLVGWAPTPPPFIWVHGVAVTWQGPLPGAAWAFCPPAAIFAPVLTGRVVAGAAAAPIAARMHLSGAAAAATPIAGPTPERLGFSPAQIPRLAGPAAVGVAHALQLSRPSTAAMALGAHPPTRMMSPALPAGMASTALGAGGPGFQNATPTGGAGAHGGGRRR